MIDASNLSMFLAIRSFKLGSLLKRVNGNQILNDLPHVSQTRDMIQPKLVIHIRLLGQSVHVYGGLDRQQLKISFSFWLETNLLTFFPLIYNINHIQYVRPKLVLLVFLFQ